MQNDQVKGMMDRAIAVLATMFLGWLVKKGWLGESDAATLMPALVLLPALAWGWWNNRPRAIALSAVAIPGIKLEADHNAPDEIKALAADPTQPNVVSK